MQRTCQALPNSVLVIIFKRLFNVEIAPDLKRKGNGYWKIAQNQRNFLDELANDWYKLTTDQVSKLGGRGLLHQFNDSLFKALQTIYPEHQFVQWKFYVQKSFWNDDKHLLEFFDWLQEKTEDWYSLKEDDFRIINNPLDRFEGSLGEALAYLYPDKQWFPWLFKNFSLSSKYWHNQENQLSFIDWLKEHRNFKTLEDWYKIRKLDFSSNGAKGFLVLYEDSIASIMKTFFPQHNWNEEKFPPPGKKISKFVTLDAQKKFMDELFKLFGLKKMEDWYSITTSKILGADGGVALLCRYGYSLSKILETLYPEYEWKPWLFSEAPKGFWNEIKNQREFLNWLFKKLELKTQSDWYGVSSNTVKEFGGSGLLHYYNNSITKALQVAYPEFNWNEEEFVRHSRGHWEKLESHQKQLENIEKALGIKTKEDWYKVKKEDVLKVKGEGFLKYHNNSLPKALENVYPDHNWIPWKFSSTPKNYWEEFEHVKEYIKWLEKELLILRPQDWYKISYKQISIFGGDNLLRQYGGLLNILSQIYTNVSWDPKFFARGLNWGKTQWSLYLVIQNIFPKTLVHSDYPHSRLKWRNGNQSMQLDIYIPELNLAFEYQGIHHYEFTWLLGEPTKFKERDEEKRDACKREGITLIEIPYWWDNTEAEIRATIHKYRPDLIPNPGNGNPIPETPPRKEEESQEL